MMTRPSFGTSPRTETTPARTSVARRAAALGSACGLCISAPALAGQASDPPCGSGGSCYAKGFEPGCLNIACCEKVCALDQFCCEQQWDLLCGDEALHLCTTCGDPSIGSCLVERLEQPSCSDAACCGAVCRIDAFCCDVAWDSYCVGTAFGACDLCGVPGAGSCLAPHATPSCDDEPCCRDVCTLDPACCTAAWDAGCAIAAASLCADCDEPRAGSCLSPHANPACNEANCCASVCMTDTTCCEVAWDEGCARLAIELCTTCGVPGTGACTVPHDLPSCSDAACCTIVCLADPHCCEETWDASCAGAAVEACVETCGGPLAGSCCDEHPNPFCRDLECCDLVCASEPSCCLDTWDKWCTFVAWSLCDSCCPTCRGDFDGDAQIDAVDLTMLLANWGTPTGGLECGFDLTADFHVDAADLATLLARWGPCPR
jgi:hypothetical protein